MREDNDSRARLSLILAYLQSSKLFADVIGHYIHRSGKKQKDLAKELSVDTSAITHWRKGRRIPQDSTFIFKLSTVLSLEADERQRLLLAWYITRGFKDLIPYVETAIKEGDETTQIVESIVEYLHNSLQTIQDV